MFCISVHGEVSLGVKLPEGVGIFSRLFARTIIRFLTSALGRKARFLYTATREVFQGVSKKR